MLTSINIQLEALNNTTFTTDSALGINGAFYKILEEINPQLSEELHNLDQLKPYTLSSLKEYNRDYRTQGIEKGKLYSFRVTILNELVFNTFYEGLSLYFANNKTFIIGKGHLKVINFNIESSTTFEEIVQKANGAINRFKIEFKSPTSFRRLGKNYLFPDPEQLIKTYVEKWNSFAPILYQITEEEKAELQESCLATQFELKTELINMNRYKIIGFRGSCHYQLDKGTSQEIIIIMNRILSFIPYSGTGYKTTMGMGQTDVKW